MKREQRNVAFEIGHWYDREGRVPLIQWIASPSTSDYAGQGPTRFCYRVRCAACGHVLQYNQRSRQWKHSWNHEWANRSKVQA